MEPIVLGQDLGMGANKLWGIHGGQALQSVVAVETNQAFVAMLGFRNRKPPMHIRLDGVGFYVGSGAHDWGRPVEALDYERLTAVPETRAIIYANLTRYIQLHGSFAAPVHMIVGLPLEPLSGPEAATNAEAVRRWLKGTHAWEADGQLYQLAIEDVKIASQPSGALFDYLLDDCGQFILERKGQFGREIGVISIGFNTLEMLTVRDKTPVQSLTAGRTTGVRRLLELLNMDGHYTLGELDERLRNGMLDTKAALPVWAREISGQVEKLWGSRWKRFASILVVGGGALLLREYLSERFQGKLHIPDDPVLAIAHGLYKLGKMQQRKGRPG